MVVGKHRSRIGDIFKIGVGGGKHSYFQFVALDPAYMNSDVVAVFKGIFNNNLPQEEIINLPIDFFSHATVKWGVPEYWEFVGKAQPIDSSLAIFKDVDTVLENKDLREGESSHWRIWKIDQDFKYVGSYDKVPKEAVLGMIFPPDELVHRIKTGKYQFKWWGVDK